jgi:hypothetical protein
MNEAFDITLISRQPSGGSFFDFVAAVGEQPDLFGRRFHDKALGLSLCHRTASLLQQLFLSSQACTTHEH